MPRFTFTGRSTGRAPIVVDLPASSGGVEGFYLVPGRFYELAPERWEALLAARPGVEADCALQPEPGERPAPGVKVAREPAPERPGPGEEHGVAPEPPQAPPAAPRGSAGRGGTRGRG